MKRYPLALLGSAIIILGLLLVDNFSSSTEPEVTPAPKNTPSQPTVPESFRGQSMPEISLQGPQGNLQTQNLQGQPVLLEFILTDCQHCQAMAPRIRRALKGSDVSLLTVGLGGETLSSMARWKREKRQPGTYAVGGEDVTQDLYLYGTPTIFFIDSRGIVQEVTVGEISESTLSSLLETIN